MLNFFTTQLFMLVEKTAIPLVIGMSIYLLFFLINPMGKPWKKQQRSILEMGFVEAVKIYFLATICSILSVYAMSIVFYSIWGFVNFLADGYWPAVYL